jgi:hypothetical protein
MQQASQASNEVRLPRAIRERSERINLKLSALNPPGATDGPVDPNAIPVTPDANGATPAADPAPNPPASLKPVDPRHADPKYWMQRFEVMMGVLTKERTEHGQEIGQLETRLAELETQVSTLEAENTTLKQNPSPSSSIDIGQFLDPETVERIGEDEATAIVEVAMKAAQQAVEKAVKTAPASPTKPATTREDREAERERKQAKQAFLDQLVEAHVDFFEMDVDPRWGEWLAKSVKEGSKKTRQDVLDQACRSLDHEAAVDLMTEFKATLVSAPPPITAHAEGGQIDDSGAPASGGANALRAPTNAEVKAFYARAALGKVTPEERKSFEARQKLRTALR